MSVGHLIINTICYELTVVSVIIEMKTKDRTQLKMKAYRLMRNRMIVILGSDFHIASTSNGSVRKYSYTYQANFEISNVSTIGI